MALIDEKKEPIIDKNAQEIEKEILKIRKGELKISDITKSYPNAQEIIDGAIDFKPSLFADLRPDQRTENNALLFVKHILTTTQNQNEKEVLYYQTIELEPALKIHYTSVADESIEYFDNDLELPTQLKSKLSLSLVIKDAMKLLSFLNLKLSDFSLVRLYNTVRLEITDVVKKELLNYIKNNKLGYFNFEFACNILGDSINNSLQKVFAQYGIEVIKFNFEKLSIPDKIVKIIQDEYMNARSLSIRSQAEIQWATSSLEILKLKSEILEKYNLPADTLSEMEKDKALERYIRKAKQLMNEKIEFQKEEANDNNGEGILIATKPTEPKKPDEVVDSSKDKLIKLIAGAGVGLILSVAGYALKQQILIILGIIAMLVFVSFIVLLSVKKKQNKQLYEEYEAAMQIYNEAYKVYVKEKSEYEDALKKLNSDRKKYYLKDNAVYEKRTVL